jgi:hypothetical protein
MKAKLIYAIVFTFFVHMADGQIFGIRGGVNLASITISAAGLNIVPESVTGFHFGPVADFKIRGNLHINTGLIYSLKGYKIGLEAESTTYKINCLDIPLNLAFRFPLGRKSSVFIQTGPYLGYTINGKSKFGGEIEAITIGEGGMKRYDFGFGTGAGLNFGSLTTSLNYQRGLANMNADPADDAKLQHKVFQVSVAYMFTK